MSYDMTIFFESDPSERLPQLIAAESDLTIEREAAGVTVYRGKGIYCCSVGQPLRVDEEDLPDAIASRSVSFSFQVDVLVEGSNPTSIARTRKLVRHIVRSLDGVSWDPQTEAVDPRAARRFAPSAPSGLVNIVEFVWYAPPREGVAMTYLDATRRFLPEAAPRRFGSYEPLAFRLDRDGPDVFVSEAETDQLLFFKGTQPVLEGSLRVNDRNGTRVSMSVLETSLYASPWRDSARAFFLEVSEQLDCFFASAQVVRNLTWSGRQIWHGRDAESTYSLSWREGWMGLPPHPVWWAYLGRQYSPLIELNGPGASPRGDATLIELSILPADRDALTATLPRRGLFRRPSPWVQPSLQVKPIDDSRRMNPPHAGRADVIPDGLGVSVAPAGYRMHSPLR